MTYEFSTKQMDAILADLEAMDGAVRDAGSLQRIIALLRAGKVPVLPWSAPQRELYKELTGEYPEEDP